MTGDITAILAECERQGVTMPEQLAYVLATVEHETNATFLPVREAYWLSEQWRKLNLWYYPYYGRGYVQITLEPNYAKFADLTGKDLVNAPDLALEPATAAFILVYGFVHGSFTGKKITDYIRPGHVDFINARRCINGRDRAERIAGLARKWVDRLNRGEV